MYSTFDDIIFCLILILPIGLFSALAKKHWSDKDLRNAFQKGILAGFIAIVLARLIYLPIGIFLGGDVKKFLSAPREWYLSLFFCIGIIGLIEEGFKALAAYTACCFYKSEGFRPTFIFISFAGCALSFSLFENIQYYMIYGPSIVLPRVLISSTAHLFFGCIAALFSNLSYGNKSFIKVLLWLNTGIISSAICHGFFDFMLFQYSVWSLSGLILAVLSFFIYAIYEIWIYSLKLDIPSAGNLSVCSKCRALTIERIRFCPFCGNRVVKINNLPTILKQ